MHILFQYLSRMYLSSLIFFTSTVSSASDSTFFNISAASLSTEAIRYNAPWLSQLQIAPALSTSFQPADDVDPPRPWWTCCSPPPWASSTSSPLPAAEGWPHGVPMVSPMDDPMDDGWWLMAGHLRWSCGYIRALRFWQAGHLVTIGNLVQVAGCRMLQVAGCTFLQNSSVSWIPVWPGALNFGDAVRCQTGYMQVAKAGNRQQNIAKHNESQPMETRLQLRTWRSMKNRNDFGIWRFGGDGLFCQLFLQIEAAVPWHFGS